MAKSRLAARVTRGTVPSPSGTVPLFAFTRWAKDGKKGTVPRKSGTVPLFPPRLIRKPSGWIGTARLAAPFLAALCVSAPVQAQTTAPADAQAMIDAQRAELTERARIGCRRSADPELITVCGAREDRRYRVVDTVEPGEIRTAWRAGGEQLAAMSNDRCFRLCQSMVGVTLIDTGRGRDATDFAAALLERLADDE